MTKLSILFTILALFAISSVAQIRPVTRPVRTQQNQQPTQPVRQQSAQPARQNNVQQQSQPAKQQQAQPSRQQTVQPAQTSTTSSRDKILANLAADMVYVEGGTFTMGATAEQGSDADDDEKPAHQVTLSSFYICKHEVTQEEWEAVMGSNPSNMKGKRLPVEQVTWTDCQTFINKLNSLTGKQYRLPTEAEWEYAARGGNRSNGYKYSGSNTLGIVAWYLFNGKKNREVMTRSPNELGLYDMSGNVLEWCSDWYGEYPSSAQTNPKGPSSGSDRVTRGGCWGSGERFCRVSIRIYGAPSSRYDYLGLRLAL